MPPPYVGDETFCLTYGEGLSDVDLGAVIDTYERAARFTPPVRLCEGLERTVAALRAR